MPRSKETLEILMKAIDIHEKKNKDYADDSNPFENFERAAILASWFKDEVDKVFATLIGVKIARLATLHNKGGFAQNEPVADTHLDATTYHALWGGYRASLRNRQGLQSNPVEEYTEKDFNWNSSPTKGQDIEKIEKEKLVMDRDLAQMLSPTSPTCTICNMPINSLMPHIVKGMHSFHKDCFRPGIFK